MPLVKAIHTAHGLVNQGGHTASVRFLGEFYKFNSARSLALVKITS